VPIYEYACGTCEHRFETIQRASEEPLKDCPACGESALKKLLSAPVFRLKGGGWYETDFKTGNKRNISGTDESNGKSDGQDNGDGSGKTASSEKASDGSKAGDSASKSASTEKTATTASA